MAQRKPTADGEQLPACASDCLSAELERLNGRPFLLYPSEASRHWTEPAWKDGRLAAELGEDVDLAFADPDYPFTTRELHVETNAAPLSGRPLRVDRFIVFLLSGPRGAPLNDSTIVLGERIGPIPLQAAFETLRETFGATQVHRVVTPADEGMGDIPGISIFGEQKGREVLLRRDGNLICGAARPLAPPANMSARTDIKDASGTSRRHSPQLHSRRSREAQRAALRLQWLLL